MDIFEDLKERIGCDYISDLTFEPYKSKAKKRILEMPMETYPPEMLSDMAAYLYGGQHSFRTSQEAAVFFKRCSKGMARNSF